MSIRAGRSEPDLTDLVTAIWFSIPVAGGSARVKVWANSKKADELDMLHILAVD